MRELVFAYLASRREFRDAARCRKALVGPMRRYLARVSGAEVADWPGLPPHAALLIQERAEAAESLADFCRRCGRCRKSEIFQ